MKLYAIGDIHGCYDEFIELLGKIEADRGDEPAKLVLLGDYTDRGPKSCEVVEHIISMLPEGRNHKEDLKVVPIRGNHDQMFLDAIRGGDGGMFIYNGGIQTYKSYERNNMILQDHRKFFASLPYTHRDGDFVFVHAGLDPKLPYDEQNEHVYLWERGYTLYDGDYHDNVFVVHGHTPVKGVLQLKNQINIDTGCVFGRYAQDTLGNDTIEYGLLTAARFDSRDDIKFVQVQKKDIPVSEHDEG